MGENKGNRTVAIGLMLFALFSCWEPDLPGSHGSGRRHQRLVGCPGLRRHRCRLAARGCPGHGLLGL